MLCNKNRSYSRNIMFSFIPFSFLSWDSFYIYSLHGIQLVISIFRQTRSRKTDLLQKFIECKLGSLFCQFLNNDVFSSEQMIKINDKKIEMFPILHSPVSHHNTIKFSEILLRIINIWFMCDIHFIFHLFWLQSGRRFKASWTWQI